MSEVERAWVGAFIEADGCAFIRRRPNRTGSIVVSVTQKELDPIATLLRITGAGAIQLHQGSMWYWTVARMNESKTLARQCAPYSWKLQRVLKEV